MYQTVVDSVSWWYIGICCLILVVSWIVIGRKLYQTTKIDIPRDVVLLYQVGRGPRAPSSSPFPLKLETFLRMYKIPYMNDHTSKFSSKGKTPWIQYNGISMADSDLCIRYLKQERHIPDENLDSVLRATGRAFYKMTEENLYWTMCHVMFIKNQDKVGEVMPQYKGLKLKLLVAVLSRVLRLEMWGHGIGRHSSEDILSIGKEDLSALSTFLGEKSFVLGQEPKEVDCSIFGMLSQIIYHMPGSFHEQLVKEMYPNLLTYCERMKVRFWPDWNKRCYNPDKPRDDMGYIYFHNQDENDQEKITQDIHM